MSTYSLLAHTNHEKLPDELLAEIFLESSEQCLSIPYNPRESIWVLPRVCSRWRRIAFGTRTLWSNLWLRDLDGRLRNVYTRMLKEALVRSGRALLSLHINKDIPEDIWFPVLVPHLGRVRGLEVTQLPRSFLSLPSNSFPSLEQYDGWDLELLPNMTALRQVSFRFWSGTSTALLSQLPLSQLISMNIHDSQLLPGDALQLLLQCPSLIHCSLGIESYGYYSEDLHPGQVSPPHTLPFLSSLEIYANVDGGTLSCFQSLRLPRLRYFKLSNRSWGEELEDLEWLPEFITFSGILQTLNLWCSISASDLQRTLQGTPFLQRLEISQDVLPALVLRRIGTGVLLPRLERLSGKLKDAGKSLDRYLAAVEKRGSKGVPATQILRLDLTLRRNEKIPRVDPEYEKIRNNALLIKLWEEGYVVKIRISRQWEWGTFHTLIGS